MNRFSFYHAAAPSADMTDSDRNVTKFVAKYPAALKERILLRVFGGRK